MGDTIILAILAVGGIVAAIPITLSAFTQLRDELVDQGWVKDNSILGKMSLRAQNARILRISRALNLDDLLKDAVRREGRRINQQSSRGRAKADLSKNLLMHLRACTHTLEDEFSYDETGQYYIDSMGSMYSPSESQDTEPGRLMYGWLSALEEHSIIGPVDCILANKAGNILMAKQLTSYMSSSADIGLVVAKSQNDKSRVKRPSPEIPHSTDFEGLDAFLAQNADKVRQKQKFRAVFVDGNCAGAKTLTEAITAFNSLAEKGGVPFHPIEHALVLFALRSNKAWDRCQAANIKLHAVIAIGKEDIDALINSPSENLKKSVDKFRNYFACESSRKLNV